MRSFSASSDTVPASGAVDVFPQPVLEWDPVPWAWEYVVELARDAAFTDIYYTGSSRGTSHTVGEILDQEAREGDVRGFARAVNCGQDIASDGAFAVEMIAEFEPALEAYGSWFYRRLHWEAGALGQVLYLEAEAAGLRGTGIGCFFDDAIHQVLGITDRRLQMLYGFTVGGPIDDPRLITEPAY